MTRRFRAFAAAAFLACIGALPVAAQYATAIVQTVAGSGTAYTGTVVNATSYSAITQVTLTFAPNVTNTGDATLQLNGFGTAPHFNKPTSGGLSPLAAGDLVANQKYLITYDLANNTFDLLSPPPVGGAGAVPQGYITPCQVSAGSPVTGCTAGQLMPTGDVTAATNLYYEPVVGSTIPIYNGSSFITFQFSELTLAVPSSRLANTIYDVLIFSNAGVVTPCISVAWTTSTAGSGNRGSGAGTAQIAQVNGIWTNAVAVTGCVNGASSFNISANQGTVVATCLVDGTNGQLTFTSAIGQSRKWACVNFYNKQQITLQLQDPATSNWSYLTNSWRQSHGSTSNTVTVLQAIALEDVDIQFFQTLNYTCSNTAAAGGSIGIGINSTTTPSGQVGQNECLPGATTVTDNVDTVNVAHAILPRGIGSNAINAIEYALGTNGSAFSGAGTPASGLGSMLLTARWRG